MSRLRAPAIHAATQTLPEHFVRQAEMTAYFEQKWEGHRNFGRVDELHQKVGVESRHLAVPLHELDALDSFAQRNDAYIRCATELGERAIVEALERAGLRAADIDHIFFVSVTGLATPSIDARLVNRLGMRADVKRTPIWGLGCVGGAAGIARAADYLVGFPDQTVVLLAVELCLLTYQRQDMSITNVISTGLFGDGASAVILRGADVACGDGPRVIATRSRFYPNTEQLMGWNVVDTGLQLVLSPEVPELVRRHIAPDVDEFLGEHGLQRSMIDHWLLHTGGPRVLEAFGSTLGLGDGALERSWRSLAEVGNVSSASVLFVLADMLSSGAATPGDHGLLAAVGPAFCSELVLLRW